MRRRPARAGERGGEQRLCAARDLLAAQPQYGLDGEAAGEQGDDGHGRGEERVHDRRPARPREVVLDLRARVEQVADVAREGPVRGAERAESRRPAERRAALKPQRQPLRAAQRRRGRRRAGPRPQQPRALIAALQQPEGGRDERGGDDEHQRQRPPALTRIGPHGLRPADRRQPRQRPVAHVADRAHDVRRAEHSAGDPARRAGGRRHLRGDRADPGQDERDAGGRRAEGDGARRREPRGEQPERQAGSDQHRGEGRDQQSGGERRGAPGGCGEHELRTSGLLVAARVAHHEQCAHQPGQHRGEPSELPGQRPAGGVQRVLRAAQRDQRAVAGDAGGERVPVDLRRIGAPEARAGEDHEGREPEHPERQDPAVAPQRQPQQRPRAAHGASP